MTVNSPTTEKHLQATFDFIEGIEREQIFQIHSDYPTIDGIQITMQRGKREYLLNANGMNSAPGGNYQYQSTFYGFCDSFFIKNDSRQLFLAKGIAGAKQTLSTGKTEGKVWEIESDFIINDLLYHRLIIPQNMQYGTMARHIESERLRVGEWLTGAGFVNVQINENIYHLFFYSWQSDTSKRQPYFFIDSTFPLLAEDFAKSVNAILHATAFITGELPRDEMYIIQAEDAEFKKITGAQYTRLEDSVDSKMDVVAPSIMRQLNIGEPLTGYVSQQVLSNLATHAYNDERMFRALKIVLESGKYPLEIRGATYSVALETLRNIILDGKSLVSKPFKEKKGMNEVIANLKRIVEESSDEIYNNKKMILNKIGQLNQPANSSSFAACFRQLGIDLAEADLNMLEDRNKFLHGRLPFEDEFKMGKSQELRFTVFKYHFLLSLLVLKFCGHSGYVKDNANFYSALSGRERVPSRQLFKMI